MHRASRSSLDTAASWSRPSLLISPSAAGTESGISSPPTSDDGDNDRLDERKLLGRSAMASTSTNPFPGDDFGTISPFASPSVSPPRRESFHYDDVGPTRHDSTDRLAVAAEEGSLVGARAGVHVPKIKTNFRESNDPSRSGANSAARSQQSDRSEASWSGLLARVEDMAGRFRQIYAKEGVPGVVRDFQSGPLASAKATVASSTPLSSLRNLIAVIPPRRRALLLATASVIALFLLFAPADGIATSRRGGLFRRRGGSAAKALAVLQSSTSALALVPEDYPKSANKAKMLESVSNPYGYMNLIDPYTGGAFNPSILVLPDQAGLGWRHVFVSRGEEKYEVINGEDTRWEKLLGCFLLPMKRAHLELPYLARESELWTLDLPAKRKVDYMRCHNKDFDQFIGPEDPRLFFTDDGQPLLVYSQNGRIPNVCRALYIIDARMVIPGLDKALQRAGWNAPMQFREQTDLIRENQFNIEKNWSPFLGENDDLFFHVSLVPQQVYKYVPNLTLRPLDPLAPAHNCLTDLLGADMNRVHVHHATPLLRATLCKRGECVPDTSNTVMFGMVHVKYHPLPYLHYVRHIVTWNTTAPYEYLSVSKPLTYSGTNQADPIFTTSMAWDKPSKRHGLGLNHGFLDDTVLISFGVADYGSAYIDVLARDLLTDHNLCSGVQGTSLWRGSA